MKRLKGRERVFEHDDGPMKRGEVRGGHQLRRVANAKIETKSHTLGYAELPAVDLASPPHSHHLREVRLKERTPKTRKLSWSLQERELYGGRDDILFLFIGKVVGGVMIELIKVRGSSFQEFEGFPADVHKDGIPTFDGVGFKVDAVLEGLAVEIEALDGVERW